MIRFNFVIEDVVKSSSMFLSGADASKQVGIFLSKCTSSIFVVFCGHSFWCKLNQVGPCHHNVWVFNADGNNPREMASAGLSSVLTWCHLYWLVRSWISATLFATNVFQVLAGCASHPKTTIESVQRWYSWTSMWRNEILILEINFANRRAAQSSSFGSVVAFLVVRPVILNKVDKLGYFR